MAVKVSAIMVVREQKEGGDSAFEIIAGRDDTCVTSGWFYGGSGVVGLKVELYGFPRREQAHIIVHRKHVDWDVGCWRRIESVTVTGHRLFGKGILQIIGHMLWSRFL